MVDSVKNYGIAGVSTTLELGKQGAKIAEEASKQAQTLQEQVEEISKANAALALSYLAHSNLCVN